MRKFKLSAIAAAVVLASSANLAWADTSGMTNQQIQAMVGQIVNQRTSSLQKQVSQLQNQVVSLKSQLRTKSRSQPVVVGRAPDQSTSHPVQLYGADNPQHPRYKSIDQVQAERQFAADDRSALLYLGGTPVFTSPYLGINSAYDGSDLIVNDSSVNLDTALLKQTQALDEALIQKGLPMPQHPVVDLSGEIQGTGSMASQHPGNSKGDIDVTDAELDTLVQVNPWVLGYMSLGFDNSANSPYRVANSRIILDKGFITLGNLTKSPFYASLGQLYVPFGQYSTYMISDPLTKDMARTKGRAFVLGAYPQGEAGLYAATYVFRSDDHANNSAGSGLTIGSKNVIGNLHTNVSIGAISTIADSIGMQSTGAPGSITNTIPSGFSGFGTTLPSAPGINPEQLQHGVPAGDAQASFNYGNYGLITEYVTATRPFAYQDLNFNGQGARPQAFHSELVYHFQCHDKPGSVAVGYDFTKQALALLLPKERWIGTINYSFFRDTVASLEYRHDKNYSSTDTAGGGQTGVVFNPLNNYVNMVTAQFTLFF